MNNQPKVTLRKNSLPKNEVKHLVKWEFTDGCEFYMRDPAGQDGWEMSIGTNIELTCPHGNKAGVGNEPE
jgi:hypothetical protein